MKSYMGCRCYNAAMANIDALVSRLLEFVAMAQSNDLATQIEGVTECISLIPLKETLQFCRSLTQAIIPRLNALLKGDASCCGSAIRLAHKLSLGAARCRLLGVSLQHDMHFREVETSPAMCG